MDLVSLAEKQLEPFECIRRAMPTDYLHRCRDLLKTKKIDPARKLPFFLLWIRRTDGRYLSKVDGYLRLLYGATGRKASRNDLFARLFDIESKQHPLGALFEIQIPIQLIQSYGEKHVQPYPKGHVQFRRVSHDVALALDGATIYFDMTILCHDARTQDLYDAALRRQRREPSFGMDEDTARILRRLCEKDDKAGKGGGLVVCLGLGDHEPDEIAVETSIQAFFDSRPKSHLLILLYRWSGQEFCFEGGPFPECSRDVAVANVRQIASKIRKQKAR